MVLFTGRKRLHEEAKKMIWALGIVLFTATYLSADSIITLDFEGFTDGAILSNQYSDVAFSDTMVLTSGISLNEFEFPPHSGVNVISDNGGPLSLSFSTPVTSFGGYFTYSEPLTIVAFDSGNNQIASAMSPFFNNEGLSGQPGSSPNEFLFVNFAGGISRVTIIGAAAGGSFTLDDMVYTTGFTSVAEPSTCFLSFLPLLVLALRLRNRNWVRETNLIHGAAQRIGKHPAVATIIVMCLLGLRLSAQHSIGGVYVSPRTAIIGQPSTLTISISIPDANVIRDGITVVRSTSPDGATVLGALRDDGTKGDQTAGDGIYTGQITLNEVNAGQVHLQISIPFKGSLSRTKIDAPPIFIQSANAAELALSGLTSALNSGDITTAVQYFIDSDKALALLSKLDAAGQQKLANAFANATLIRAASDIRIYHSSWVTASGQNTTLGFGVGLAANGKWMVISW